MFSKEAVADPMRVQSAVAKRHGVYMILNGKVGLTGCGLHGYRLVSIF